MQTDTTLKDVLWQGAPGLLRQLTGQTAAEILPTEYPDVRARRPDFVARLTDGRLFHLELQATVDADMAARMLDYYGLISWRNGGEPVTQMVLALSDAVARRMPTGLSHPGLRLTYPVVSIESLDPAPLLESGHADDAVLAILCNWTDIQTRVRSILTRLTDLDPPRRRDALARLMVLAGLRRSGLDVLEEVTAMAVRLDIRENDFLRHVFSQGLAEGEARGLAEGEARGLAEGEARGLAEGRADTLVRLLRRRFGPLPDSAEARIHAASAAHLTQWLDRVLDAPSLEDLFDDPRPA